MDSIPIVAVTGGAYTAFVLLFIRFMGMLRKKDEVVVQQERITEPSTLPTETLA